MAMERGKRCGLFLGGLFLGLASLIALVAVPWWVTWQGYREAAAVTGERVARYRALLDSRQQLEEELAGLREQLRQRGFFIEAANPELVAADLQQRIKEIVGKSGGTLVSTQSLSSDGAEQARKVEIKVRMKGNVESLAKVLHELENSTPVVTVEDLSIRSRRTVRGRKKNRVEGYSLDTSFRVVGHMLEPAS